MYRTFLSLLLLLTTTFASAQKLRYDKVVDGERYLSTSFKSIYTRGSGNGQLAFGALVNKQNNVTFYIGLKISDEANEMHIAKGRRLVLDLSDGSTITLRTEDKGKETHERHITPVTEMHTMFGWHTWYDPYYSCYLSLHGYPYGFVTHYNEVYDYDSVIVYFEATPQQLLDIAEKKVKNVHIETNEESIDHDIWSNKFSKTLIKEYHIIARALGMED